jgi:hypothetical protein
MTVNKGEIRVKYRIGIDISIDGPLSNQDAFIHNIISLSSIGCNHQQNDLE